LDDVRKKALWGTLMAGGAGVEYYFGYQRPHSDLTCQDLRSRNDSWEYCKIALDFFNQYVPFWEMNSADGIVSNNNGYGFSKAGEVYVVYLRNGGSTTVDLASGSYTVKWFNPRTGGALVNGSVTSVSGGNNKSIGSAPTNNDWVALIRSTSFSHPGNPGSSTPVAVTGVNLSPSTLTVGIGETGTLSPTVLPTNATNKLVTWSSSNTSIATVNGGGTVTGVAAGTTTITVTTVDGSFTATSTVTVEPTTTFNLSAVQDAYLQNSTRFNTADLRIEAGRRVSYLMFDLSSVTGTINSVELNLSVSNDAGNGTITVAKGNSNNWTEANLSTSNAPTSSGQLGSLNKTYSIGQTSTWVLDETAISAGGMLSLIVSQTSGGDVSFASDENSNAALRPELIIETTKNGSIQKRSNIQAAPVVAYPQPFTNVLNLTLPQGHAYNKIQVVDLLGQVLHTQLINEQTNVSIQSTRLMEANAGVYVIRLMGGDQLNVLKVIKK